MSEDPGSTTSLVPTRTLSSGKLVRLKWKVAAPVVITTDWEVSITEIVPDRFPLVPEERVVNA
jgi:hypothetical protein